MIHTNLTPRIVNTLFLLAVQNYFMYHPEYTWSLDDGITKIDVTTDFSEDGEMSATMPIVTVQNGPSFIEPAGIGTGIEAAKYRDYFRGEQVSGRRGVVDSVHKFVVRSSTTVTIFCFTKDAADELAFEIAMLFMMIKYSVGSVLQIQNIENAQISQAQPVDRNGWSNKYTAAVSIGYTFSVNRLYQPADPGILLKSIETALTPVISELYHDATADLKDDNMVSLRFKSALEVACDENCACGCHKTATDETTEGIKDPMSPTDPDTSDEGEDQDTINDTKPDSPFEIDPDTGLPTKKDGGTHDDRVTTDDRMKGWVLTSDYVQATHQDEDQGIIYTANT